MGRVAGLNVAARKENSGAFGTNLSSTSTQAIALDTARVEGTKTLLFQTSLIQGAGHFHFRSMRFAFWCERVVKQNFIAVAWSGVKIFSELHGP